MECYLSHWIYFFFCTKQETSEQTMTKYFVNFRFDSLESDFTFYAAEQIEFYS